MKITKSARLMERRINAGWARTTVWSPVHRIDEVRAAVEALVGRPPVIQQQVPKTRPAKLALKGPTG